MPTIRNLALLKRFTDYFKLKTFDTLDAQAGRMLVPVVALQVPPNIIQLSDVTANQISKTFTVPNGKQWRILYGKVSLVTTATVGTRRISIRFLDVGSNIIYFLQTNNTQAASLTEQYTFGTFGDIGEVASARHTLPLPVHAILPSGFAFQIIEPNGVDTSDDMEVFFMVEETDLEDI